MSQKSKTPRFVSIFLAGKTTLQMRKRLPHHWKDSDERINQLKAPLPQIHSVPQGCAVSSETGTHRFFPCPNWFVSLSCTHEQSIVKIYTNKQIFVYALCKKTCKYINRSLVFCPAVQSFITRPLLLVGIRNGRVPPSAKGHRGAACAWSVLRRRWCSVLVLRVRLCLTSSNRRYGPARLQHFFFSSVYFSYFCIHFFLLLLIFPNILNISIRKITLYMKMENVNCAFEKC